MIKCGLIGLQKKYGSYLVTFFSSIGYLMLMVCIYSIHTIQSKGNLELKVGDQIPQSPWLLDLLILRTVIMMQIVTHVNTMWYSFAKSKEITPYHYLPLPGEANH